jgi:hypothetical protein
MRRSLIAMLLVAACGGTAVTTTELTTTTIAPTTTAVDQVAAAEAWFGHLIDWFDHYGTEFFGPYESHFGILTLDEAQLDCVEAQALLPGWRDSVPEAPDPQLEALTATMFERVEEGIDGCVNAVTVGDYRAAHDTLLEVGTIVDRLSARLNEIQDAG